MPLQVITSFSGPHAWASNFAPVTICYKSIKYPTVEHAYAASKSLDLDFRNQIAALNADQAGKAKRMGRNIQLRPGWDEIKIPLMYQFLQQKFDQQPFENLLLVTGNAYLMEGNYWHDKFWGCTFEDECWTGLNWLGRLLMMIRDSKLAAI